MTASVDRRLRHPASVAWAASLLAAACLAVSPAAAATLRANGPYAGLTLGNDGYFYGTTTFSAQSVGGSGTVFRVKPDGTSAKVLTNFTGGYPYGVGNGNAPRGGVSAGPAGDRRLYGTAVTGGHSPDFSAYGVVYSFDPAVNTVKDIHTFGKPPADESNSWARLSLLSNGHFYGTTSGNPYGLRAAVFRIGRSGQYLRLGQFAATSPTGGVVSSLAGLTQVGNNLYGTTTNGGTHGLGSVFRIPIGGGTPVDIHSFNGKDGWDPRGDLEVGPNNVLYGTTMHGGSAYAPNVEGHGTIFRVTIWGNFKTLVDFDADPSKTGNGANPIAGLTWDPTDGNFYGTTTIGGNGGPINSWLGGIAFKMTPDGVLTKLVDFYGNNGMYPTGRLLAYGGALYGTTYSGGAYGVAWAPVGIVFKMTRAGKLTKLINFRGD